MTGKTQNSPCFLTSRECPRTHQQDIERIFGEKDQVFVSMKFSDKTQKLREALRESIKNPGFIPVFADELPQEEQPPHVFCPVCKHIKASRFVVADLSIESTAVGFEVGFARTLRKGLIFTYCKRIGTSLTPLLQGFLSVVASDEKDLKGKLMKAIGNSKFRPRKEAPVTSWAESMLKQYRERIRNLWNISPEEAFMEIVNSIIGNCPVCGSKNEEHWSEETVFCLGYENLGPLRLDDDEVYHGDGMGACKYCLGGVPLSLTVFSTEDDRCGVALAYLPDKKTIGVSYSPINGSLGYAQELVDFINGIGANARMVSFFPYLDFESSTSYR